MQRHTSQAAWDYLVGSKRLGPRQREAYDCIYKHGPCTAQEMVKITGIPGLWKRTSELERIGSIVNCGERNCSVTGELAVAWDVTVHVPTDEEISRLIKKRNVRCGIVWFKDGSHKRTGTKKEAWDLFDACRTAAAADRVEYVEILEARVA